MTTVRTYIRAVVHGHETVVFEIPAWKPGVWIHLSKRDVPPIERAHLHPGFRCNVTINIDAETPDQLHIRDWGLD